MRTTSIRSLDEAVREKEDQQQRYAWADLSDRMDRMAQRQDELTKLIGAPKRIVRDAKGRAVGSIIDFELAKAQRQLEAQPTEPTGLLPDDGNAA